MEIDGGEAVVKIIKRVNRCLNLEIPTLEVRESVFLKTPRLRAQP